MHDGNLLGLIFMTQARHGAMTFISNVKTLNAGAAPCALQLDVLFGNLDEMLVFQVEFLQTLEDGTRLVPDLDRLERVEQFKVRTGARASANVGSKNIRRHVTSRASRRFRNA